MTIPAGWAAQRLFQYTRSLSEGGTGASAAAQAGFPGSGAGTAEGAASFGDTLKRAISGISEAQDGARSNLDAFLRGEPVEMHQVMAAQEEAGLALEMLVEVRNKFTEAYRTVINMQS